MASKLAARGLPRTLLRSTEEEDFDGHRAGIPHPRAVGGRTGGTSRRPRRRSPANAARRSASPRKRGSPHRSSDRGPLGQRSAEERARRPSGVCGSVCAGCSRRGASRPARGPATCLPSSRANSTPTASNASLPRRGCHPPSVAGHDLLACAGPTAEVAHHLEVRVELDLPLEVLVGERHQCDPLCLQRLLGHGLTRNVPATVRAGNHAPVPGRACDPLGAKTLFTARDHRVLQAELTVDAPTRMTPKTQRVVAVPTT
jgi:hypothetical protein